MKWPIIIPPGTVSSKVITGASKTLYQSHPRSVAFSKNMLTFETARLPRATSISAIDLHSEFAVVQDEDEMAYGIQD